MCTQRRGFFDIHFATITSSIKPRIVTTIAIACIIIQTSCYELFVRNSPMGAVYRSLSLNSHYQPLRCVGVIVGNHTYIRLDLQILLPAMYERITITTTKASRVPAPV